MSDCQEGVIAFSRVWASTLVNELKCDALVLCYTIEHFKIYWTNILGLFNF
jgi:hypothetical protein